MALLEELNQVSDDVFKSLTPSKYCAVLKKTEPSSVEWGWDGDDEVLDRVQPAEACASSSASTAGSAGAAGIAATLLAMRDGVLPPTINIDEPDPQCDRDYVPEPGRKMDLEYALCNCIGFGSKNSSIVLCKVG